MVKKLVSTALCMIMAASVLAGCGKKDADTIKIGAVLPLTGDVATFGQSTKNGIQLAVDETNKKGGILGKKIEIVYEDDQNTPSSSANAGQKLINNDNVIALIGSVTSKCSIALGPIANSSKIPMISSDSTNPKVTQAGEYVFRACFIDPFQGTVLAKFATEDLKAKTAAALYDVGNDYCKGLAEFFQNGFTKAGGKMVASLTYNSGDQDFNAQLTKIKDLNPDVVLLPDYYNKVGLISKQARQMGIKATFLGGDGWDSPDLFKVGGSAVNGGYFSNHYSPDDTSPKVVEFRKNYEAKYGSTPDALAALAYDGAIIMFSAIQKAGSTDGAKIKDALKATNLQVVSGTVTFDKDRNPIKDAVIIKTQDGKQIFVKKVKP